MATAPGIPLVKAFKSDLFPLDRLDPGSDLGEFLAKILVTDYEEEVFIPGPGGRFEIDLAFAEEIVINLLGLDGFALVFGGAAAQTISLGASMLPSGWEVKLGAGARLRFPRNILKPVIREGDEWVDDTSRPFAEIEVAAGVVIDQAGNVSFDGSNAFNLAAAMVADSGIVIEGEVALDLSETTGLPESAALGLPPTWQGAVFKSLSVYLPDAVSNAVPISSLSFSNFHVGSGGVAGSISLTGAVGSGTVGGFPFQPTALEVELRQNCLVRAEIQGRLTLAFFDEPLDVVASFDLDSNFTVEVASVSGLVDLEKPGLLSLTLESIAFGQRDSVFIATISGTLTPRVGGLNWPAFRVQELSIDSQGNVHLEGGWLNLPSQYSLEFYDFQIAITRLGMGSTDDGGRWIGFSGSIKLVDGIGIGGSVDGLRISWYPDGSKGITLDGVGVELEIPETLRFKGSVSYHELPGPQHRFDGDVTLELLALDMRVDGKIVIGTDTNIGGERYKFFALFIGVELPAGIPLWATGLGLYRIAGLVAIQMAPNKGAPANALHPDSRTDEEWFENLDGSPGWYKRQATGVIDLRSKWDPVQDGFALGGGVTIGTVADNGFTFNGVLLLVISFPGPVILLEGKANLLKERAGLNDDALFRALVVLDFRAGEFLVGLMARYKFGGNGQLIDISGSAEAFFDFNDASRWHLYLGQKDPKERRIRAEILTLFEANSYFMLDATRLQTGAWVGYDQHWDFGPLSVTVEAWIEGGVIVSWKPVYFHGDLWLHGKAELSVFGFGLGMSVDARFAADVFDPFHLLAEFSVGIGLPWPLPDFDVDITLEWGPTPEEPLLSLPLKEIAVEHFKSTASWPLPRDLFLLPNADRGEGFLQTPPPAPPLSAGPPANVPIVPMDARPHITFGRSVNDDASIGVNPQPVWPAAVPIGWERIGDPGANQGPMRVRYSLQEIALSKWSGTGWIDVAAKPTTGDAVEELYGSWAPIPQLPLEPLVPAIDPPVAQVKLWLWSKTPFDYSRHGGRAWDEWFTDEFLQYPCIPPVPERTICCDFDHLPIGTVLTMPHPCHGHEELLFVGNVQGVVELLPAPSHGHPHALCWDGRPVHHDRTTLTAEGLFGVAVIGDPASRMALIFARTDSPGGVPVGPPQVDAIAIDAGGGQHGPFLPIGDTVTIEVDNLRGVLVRGRGHACLVEVCATFAPDGEEVAAREEMAKRLVDAMAFWGDAGEVLEAYTDYRIKVVTKVEAVGEDELAGINHDYDITELAYFKTQGPPALTTLSTPVYYPPGEAFDSGLDDLTRYVAQTVPATVPARGQQPLLPRPVYRAYDVGVVFNEDYVDLMYRLARRDLYLYLYDSNNRPVRDAAGRLIVSSNRWGVTETLALTESTLRYLTLIDQSTCVAADPTIIPHQVTLFAVDPGLVLESDIVYEARLVPLLLHEDFSDGVDGWTVVDSGVNFAPSEWTALGHPKIEGTGATIAGTVLTLGGAGDLSSLDVAVDAIILSTDTMRPSKTYRVLAVDNATKQVTIDGTPVLFGGSSAWTVPGWGAVRQASNIQGGASDAVSVPKPGTMLVGGDPSWTDYRLTVQLRSTDDDAIGVVFRYHDAANLYRFSMDRERRYRRLVRIEGGAATVLAEDDFVFTVDQDYVITVEAIGDSLKVYQDYDLVFDLRDPTLSDGRVGLYCWANVGARFADMRVDDFRPGAPVVYRFSFTTSGYANFFHHLHSYQDETWLTPVANTDLAAEIAAAVAPADALSDAETRAFTAFASKALGPGAQKAPERLEVHRLTADGDTVALLVRSPEPIDWKRTSLQALRADGIGREPHFPDVVKLTDVAVDGAGPNEETITLLARDRTNLAGTRVELLTIPGPLVDAPEELLIDDLFSTPGGLLFEEAFGANALDAYRIVDAPGAISSPSVWAVSGGSIIQSSNIYAGSLAAAEPRKAGTLALVGPGLANFRLTAGLRSDDNDAIGVVFRYDDDSNWYRFSMDRQRSYRRLVKCVSNRVTVLWEDHVVYEQGRSYEIRIDAHGDLIVGYLDRALLFIVRDAGVREGQVGFYCWANVGARFEVLRVESLDASPLLWQAPLLELGELTVVDGGTNDGPSVWTVASGEARQSANIWGEPAVSSTAKPGTVALLAPSFTTLQLSVRLRSTDPDAIGIVFRYEDEANWYRFSMDSNVPYRRLVKCQAGLVSVLWQDAVSYPLSVDHDLTILAAGGRVAGWLDGAQLFDLEDEGPAAGRIGFYCWANEGARFSQLAVTDPVRRIGHWQIDDEPAIGDASVWQAGAGALRQLSNSQTPGLPAALATTAVAGEAGWDDYRVVAHMRSDDDDAIGVAFRWRDRKNYYRLSLDAQQSYRRLVKVENGVVTVLWQDASRYTVGSPFTLTIDATGDRLVGYQGDDLLFDLTDAAHPNGRVGLYCWANTGARFEHITVKRPPLDSYALFKDRFNLGDMADWTIVDEGTQSGPSAWATVSGTLRQTSNIYSLPLAANAIEKPGTLALAGDPGWSDIVLSAALTSVDNDAIGLVFRYQDAANFYRFSMDRERSYRRLVKCVAGVFTTLWEDSVSYQVSRTYQVVVAAVHGHLSAWLDGVPIFEVEDNAIQHGRVGLYCWANVGAQFAGVRVFRADRLLQNFLVKDDFDWETFGRWSYITMGTQQTPAQWQTSGGELRQTSNVWGGGASAAELAKPGTIALAGDTSWSDYRITVKLSSDDDDGIGVIVRYHDAANWYRFSMDRQRSYRRLVKCAGGVISELWGDSIQYVQGRQYLITIDAVGDTLVGYLDGVELFAIRDGDVTSGGVGLYCWANVGARFQSVQVTEAGWRTHYRFGLDEQPLATVRVMIHSGNAKDWTSAPTPGLTHRFLASMQDPGHARLPASLPAELRLRDQGGAFGHSRRFLPENEYAALGGIRVLRRADGLDVAILLPAATPLGSRFTEGQYRLSFAFRRNNTAANPGSTVLSQAGDDSDEVVRLDVPWAGH